MNVDASFPAECCTSTNIDALFPGEYCTSVNVGAPFPGEYCTSVNIDTQFSFYSCSPMNIGALFLAECCTSANLDTPFAAECCSPTNIDAPFPAEYCTSTNIDAPFPAECCTPANIGGHTTIGNEELYFRIRVRHCSESRLHFRIVHHFYHRELCRASRCFMLQKQVLCRASEYSIRLRKHSVGRQSTSANRASIVTAVRVLYAINANSM